ncbi:hypothetical protein JL475_00680 [Streptomyces sp. M2CJ-2]|uniref:hypothetical protein n=1 Tax=Streptomyces sp. M2CJ-2 TaxID=2803948 RepID=UPI001923C2D2|nr:hypothetical protein [Streptomyces sp. M2CJ-2]MBL3664562.1 hypothetical protein [Streptomyces sp. M2CJ-2]
MTLDIRPTADPDHFDLYEDDQKIGEIVNHPDEEEDGTIIEDAPYWHAQVWSQMGTGKTFEGESESFDEVKQYAHEVYEEMAAERRELRKGSRPRTISTPMGGQRRR